MSWTLKYNKKLNAIEADFKGSTDLSDLYDESIRSTLYSEEYNTNLFIADLSEADLDVSITDTFSLLDLVDNTVNKSVTLAIILPENHKGTSEINIYKNMNIKHGWNVETFTDRQKAVEWIENQKN